MAKRISKEVENKLMKSLEKVSEMVNEGEDPNVAITKIASMEKILPGHVRLMVQAYNTGRTNVQRKSTDSLYEKSADFPLANAKVILDELYPDEIVTKKEASDRTVISASYNKSPDWVKSVLIAKNGGHEKAAMFSDCFTDDKQYYQIEKQDKDFASLAFNYIGEVKKAQEEMRRNLSAGQDKIASMLNRLDDYFRVPGCIPFPVVLTQSENLFGKSASILLSKISQENKYILKQASHGLNRPVDINKDPYKTILSCIGEVENYNNLDQEYTEFSKVAEEKISELKEALKKKHLRSDKTGEKTSGLIGDTIKATGTVDLTRAVLRRMPLNVPSDFENKVTFQNELAKPEHENKLKSLRNKFTFVTMLDDPVISSYDPAEVTHIYNQLAQLSPRVVEQPLILRAILRKHLAQGQLDAHELSQISDMELNLKKRNINPNKNEDNSSDVDVA